MKIRTTVTLIAFGIMVLLAWQTKANSPIFFGDPLPALTTDQLNQFEAGKDHGGSQGDGRGGVLLARGVGRAGRRRRTVLQSIPIPRHRRRA